MGILLNPYLNFRGDARLALEFYHSVFGGELRTSTFGENDMPGVEESEADQLMHGQLDAPHGITLMAADVPSSMPFTPGSSISVSLSGSDEETLRGYWNGLLEGGTMAVPFEQAPWGDIFGMLIDKFGINWLVNITPSKSE
jgi:PhnB protein